MSTQPATIVQRLWNYCNVLRDDGVSYGDYVEQLTYLLFLKMADEQEHELDKASAIPAGLGWDSLRRLDGDALETHYRHILAELGKGSGLIPTIFRKAQNKIQDPAKLRRLIELIDGEVWIGLDMDVKGEIYEGLAGEERPGHQVRCGAILHPAGADQGDGGRDAARAGGDDLRSGGRHRRLPAGRTRLPQGAQHAGP